MFLFLLQRCPPGQHRDQTNQECVIKTAAAKKPAVAAKKKTPAATTTGRCPNGSHKDKTTGNCVKHNAAKHIKFANGTKAHNGKTAAQQPRAKPLSAQQPRAKPLSAKQLASRKAPMGSAKNHKNEEHVGLDGGLWVSKPTGKRTVKNNVAIYVWKKVPAHGGGSKNWY